MRERRFREKRKRERRHYMLYSVYTCDGLVWLVMALIKMIDQQCAHKFLYLYIFSLSLSLYVIFLLLLLFISILLIL